MATPGETQKTWFQQWFQPSIIILLFCGLAGFWTSIQLHHAARDIHVPLATMDERYVRQDVKAEEDKRWEEAFRVLNEHLDKIEQKLEAAK
jgi:hypothetical protein